MRVLVHSHENITQKNALGPRMEHSPEIKSVLSFTGNDLFPRIVISLVFVRMNLKTLKMHQACQDEPR